jgi:hypothetical protein
MWCSATWPTRPARSIQARHGQSSEVRARPSCPAGKVLKWCPSKGSPLRSMLGALKSNVDPVPLPVFPTVVKPDGTVMVRMST